MVFEGGPYVQAACFCDIVIEDKAGVLSLIRVVDTLTHTAVGPAPPEDMPPVTYSMTLVVMLKSGRARGRYDLKIVPEYPSGETASPFTHTVHFEGEEKGHNAMLRMNFTFPLEGLYWFRVYLKEQELTAIPLRVKYGRTVVGATSR